MKLTYRPEIDGLRAIAVVAVILYHAQINILGHQPFKGGFIGVDIFFVISGYLITSIILKELVTSGTFSFKHFYERRIRRILPALLFVILVSLPFAWLYLLPSSLIDFSKSILYSLGFSSNFYFHYSGQQYGAESGLLKPFLQTWSLSIEEQYYILFPIILLIIFKYFRKHLLKILVIGLIISLKMADWGSKNYPSASFYFLHTRIWELIAGSILAYFEITLGNRSKNKTLNLILPSVGLFLIGHSILFFNDKMFHPSFNTLSPIIGVCLIIWFSNKNELITKMLSTKLFVGIGLISYSLYLWHYPIFAFAKIIEFTQESLFKKLLLGIVIIILSIFSYYFIERPFRNKKYKFKVIISLILILILLSVIINFNIIHKKGYTNRIQEILKKDLTEVTIWDLLKNLEGKHCHKNIDGCKFNTFFNKKIYIVGDSLMGSLIFNLKDKVTKSGYQYITSTFEGCLFFFGTNQINLITNKKYSECNNIYFQRLGKKLSDEKNSIIIFGGSYVYYKDILEGGNEIEQQIRNAFRNEILKLSNNNKIILIYSIPSNEDVHIPRKLKIFFDNLPKNIINKKIKVSDYITTQHEVYKINTKSSFELLDSIQGDNIYRVYPHTLFCNTLIKDRCVTHDDKNIFYSDYNHPSIKGAEMINDLIMKEIEKIELKSN